MHKLIKGGTSIALSLAAAASGVHCTVLVARTASRAKRVGEQVNETIAAKPPTVGFTFTLQIASGTHFLFRVEACLRA